MAKYEAFDLSWMGLINTCADCGKAIKGVGYAESLAQARAGQIFHKEHVPGDQAGDEGQSLTRSEVINAFGERVGHALIDAGYASLSSLEGLTKSELTKIEGIGAVSADAILEVLG